MLIKRIELVNYCQHEHRTIDVSGNLIAVVGHNGVGKSNMLGALQFALTGEQPGKKKDDLLHWGAKEGHVVLEFEQDGKPGRIERSVSSNKVTLEYDGVTTTGITNVAKEMETRLHMDKDLVRQSVFVRQTEVDTIISAKTDKRDREVAFQKLLGIDAAKIHKNLTDWMYAAEKPLNYDIQLTEAEQRLGSLEARLAELDDNIASTDKALADIKDEDTDDTRLKKSMAAITAVLSAQDNLKACTAAADLAKRGFEATKGLVVIAGADPKVDIATKSEEIAVLMEEIRKSENRDSRCKDVFAAERDLRDINAKQHPTDAEIAEIEKKLQDATESLAATNHAIDIRKRALGALVGGELVCPVCGAPINCDTADHLKHELTDLLIKAEATTVTVSETSAKANEMRTSATAWTFALDAAKRRLAEVQEALAKSEQPSVSIDVATDAVAKAKSDIERQKAYDTAISSKKEAIQNAEIKYNVAAKAVEDAQKRLDDAIAAATDLCGKTPEWDTARTVIADAIKEIETRREYRNKFKFNLAGYNAARNEVLTTLENLKGTIDSLKRQQAEQDRKAQALSVIERVRDWFHYQNGPRLLVTQVLAALTDDVNRFLGNFTAPFIVIPDNEQVGFKVEFTDGRSRPEDPPGTEVLSGGERVQLAVAFRLAIYTMFAGKLGLLSLDEPTAYLDDGNVDRFGVLLNKVRDIARNMHTQVFMATHERGVIPHMDSIIDLN